MRRIVCGACALIGLGGAVAAAKTSVDGTWSNGPVVFSVDLSAAPAGGDDAATLQQAVVAAAAAWNEVIGRPFFQLNFSGAGPAPASNNGINEINFSAALQGGAFFAAVAIERNGDDLRLESDVQLNPSHQWFVYHGPLRHEANGDRIPDLYRVLLHEMGHIIGLTHAEPESSPSVMRAHMSDIDGFTAQDLRDARLAVDYLFWRNAPRIVSPPSQMSSQSQQKLVLSGTGRPFFARVATIKIRSESGHRRLHFLIHDTWEKTLRLDEGKNVLRFFLRAPGGRESQFTTRLIRVR